MHLSPESWSANLVSSWLINQLAQGKDSTVKSIRVRTNTLTQLDTDDLSDIRRSATIILLTPSLLIKNYSFYYLRWRNFTFPSYKSYKISHFLHLYNIQILQKHQITPFLYSVKKSLFLTFYHISVIFDRSIIFIIFLHLPKITIFHLFYKITKNHHFPINDHFPGNTKNAQIC